MRSVKRTRPLLLDLYSCQGGAAVGYHRAGFDVVGVDIVRQSRYPFMFIQADALQFLEDLGETFDAIHASPPCQDWSTLKSLQGDHGTGWLLDATRTALVKLDKPWVIENVPGAKMHDPVVLCGSMFGLGATCRDGEYRQLRRHRQFESYGFDLTAPGRCSHDGQAVGVYGTGGGGQMTRGYKAHTEEAVEALGIDWMDKKGLSQSIPPAYTEYVGGQLIEALNLQRAA